MNKDLEHLKWLSVGFYVYAGLTALFACFPLIHLALGIALITGNLDDGKNPPPPAFFGWFFVGAATIFIVIGWALAVASLLAGKYLKQQKNYTFIFVIAVISCMFAPLGTVLGIFTIIVLMRDSVKQLFGRYDYSPASTADQPNWK